MRNILIVILIAIIGGCKQSSEEKFPQKEENHPSFFWSIGWHPNQDQFVVGGNQDTLRFFSTSNYKLLQNYPYKGTITKTKWHPSENKLAISVQDGVSESSILNLDNNESTILDSVSKEGARAIGWNHTGNLLAVGDYEGCISIFDENGNFQEKVYTNQKGMIALDWHPSQNLIAAVGDKITMYDYELDSLRTINDRTEEIEVLMLCVAWHPNGEFFATGDYGDFEYHYPPLLQYWSYDGQLIKSIKESKAEYRNIKWSNDGKLLATASEKIRLWNKQGDLVSAENSENLLWGIDWNEDGTKLVATDGEGKIIFWDSDLKRIQEFQY